MGPPHVKPTHRQQGRRLALVLSPEQGHISPMLHLAGLLHSQGFFITIIHTTMNAPDSSKYPDFNFRSISCDVPSGVRGLMLYAAVNDDVEEPLREVLETMIAEEEQEQAGLCLINDGAIYAASAAAEKVGIPRIALMTTSAAFHNVLFAMPRLREMASALEGQSVDAPVIEVPPVRVRDLPRFEKFPDYRRHEHHYKEAMRSTAAVIINTVEDLEATELRKLKQELQVPTFPMGPLHRWSPNIDGSLVAGDPTCIEWLDRQNPKSVLYISFGSWITVNEKELQEIAWGLVASGQPFLWVIRSGSARDGSTELPAELGEAMTMGKVVSWAPQQKVLRHPAVGGFWTHCGWNSTLESISEGVPMLCWPRMGDQMVNSRLVTDVWKVGIFPESDGRLERREIARVVRGLLLGDEGKETRSNVADMKAEVERSLEKGGRSHAYVNRLTNLISSLPYDRQIP